MISAKFTFKNKHINAIKNEVAKYIDNHLPIYLLHLKSMRLLHRSKIMEHLQADIQQYCHRPGISASIYQESSSAYLEFLRSEAKTWIMDTIAYAIFSHRWGQNELTFSEISQLAKIGYGLDKLTASIALGIIPTKVTNLAKEPGQPPYGDFELLDAMNALCDNNELEDHQSFVKIIQFFTKSREYQCDYVWFDTGCINKGSSAELEESIRSMFNWYRNSKICIIHLSETTDVLSLRSDPWFTRGWTLQELLAPPRIKFFDKLWQPILSTRFPDHDKLTISASNAKIHLWEHISDITQISVEHICNFQPGVHQARDALVWLSKRETTRDEDMAYCLVGLLDIPLSISYGEGTQAFYRLQVKILKRTSDMGLFNWLGRSTTKNSMVASEPKCFASSFPVQALFGRNKTVPMSITGHGLQITLVAYELKYMKVDAASGCLQQEQILQIDEYQSIWMELQTSDVFEKVELAILGEIPSDHPDHPWGLKKYLAILLGSIKDQCIRIPTKNFITVEFPSGQVWPEPMTRFIQ